MCTQQLRHRERRERICEIFSCYHHIRTSTRESLVLVWCDHIHAYVQQHTQKRFDQKVKTKVKRFDQKVKTKVKRFDQKVKTKVKRFDQKVKTKVKRFDQKVKF